MPSVRGAQVVRDIERGLDCQRQVAGQVFVCDQQFQGCGLFRRHPLQAVRQLAQAGVDDFNVDRRVQANSLARMTLAARAAQRASEPETAA